MNKEKETEDKINLALKFFNSGKFEDARIILEDLIENDSKDFIAFNLLGLIQKNYRNLDKAENLIGKAIKIAPDFVEALINLGIVLNEKGKTEEAIINFQKALKIRKDIPELYINLGATLMDIDDIEGAINYFKKAININSDIAQAQTGLEMALLKKYRLKGKFTSFLIEKK